jgi:tetratricopeptide (TPR) repeat protein
MRHKTERFAPFTAGETAAPLPYLRSPSPAWLALLLAALCAAHVTLSPTALAQEGPDERRCTGQWRATNEERIASCTVLIDSGRYQQANLAILHHDRGVAMRAKGDITAAVTNFTAAISLKPDYAHAYSDRGSARLMQHDLDSAIADLDTAIRLDANDAGAFMTRGNAFDEKADFDRAIADYNEAIRLSPNYAAAYFNRGLAFRRKGDVDHAIGDYDQAIKLDSKNASALNNRGIVWFEKGDLDRAITDYNEAIRLDPKYGDAYNGGRTSSWSMSGGRLDALAEFQGYRSSILGSDCVFGPCELQRG